MARLRLADHSRLASRGLRGHPLRFALSALGIAIGVAAMVAVAGVTQSSRAELDDLLSRLGTNLLRVEPTPDLQGTPTRLPATAEIMLRNIGPVTDASSVGAFEDVGIYRSPYVPSGKTNSVVVAAAAPTLLRTLRGRVGEGHWFTQANTAFPTVVLGSAAAARLGVEAPGTRLWIDGPGSSRPGQWWVVVGVLRPLQLAPELDGAALLPGPAARTYLGYDGTGTGVYVRADERQIVPVTEVAAATASPQHPDQVGIDRPSDALAAQLTADATLNRLLLGLAAIGLLVGGVGVSNTMIIAVIERRSEIGLRRALGATRGNIATQFLAESMLMSAVGGLAGALLGYVVTAFYAHSQGWTVSLPLWVGAAAVAVTALVGTLAGGYPAWKASRESPTTALATS
ncbi:ABC transporter permease [Pimelobacter simplex]|uniref:ABC transporter permease n=1 Tax=Nocardioides simplex TaxID=2045 RepID=UPI002150454B|nr:ABC transporter permease [Pimelobacter simplex]UUW92220.1 ABC transporter permease [Pimelobacter simplex]UUW96046.1 ABC transporter permease [Pimelobacter simplex]